MDTETLKTLARKHGLVFRGGFSVTDEDNVPPQPNGDSSVSLLLFGQAGESIWPHFSQSIEIKDGQPNPLDRWSERMGGSMAEVLGGQLLLPCGGPPHHPFIKWAKRAEALESSRLGMLIHPIHGLWHAYRFAISSSEPWVDISTTANSQKICDNCVAEPCLSVCPVKAFDGSFFDVHSCAAYLRANPNCECRSQGCLARDACPEGQESRYEQDQRIFHMQQFLLAMLHRDSH